MVEAERNGFRISLKKRAGDSLEFSHGMKILRICWGLLVLAGTSWTQTYTISTVAGGAPPATPGPGLTVSIGNPSGMATDAAGNAYFTSLNCVFRLDLKSVVTRVAGTSRAGYSGDGAAMNAQLNAPNGVAVDGAGDLFIADAGNNRIREVSNGIITTLAGGGQASLGDGGPATNATLYAPAGVAVDGQGNVFIADSGNNRVRKVSASGVIATLAGNGKAGFSGDGAAAIGASLSQPQYVAIDGQGNVFISDTGNNRVRKVSGNGVISTLAGTGTAGYAGDGGVAASAQLSQPEGVAVDGSGNVFIVDSNNERVRKVSVTGVITTVAGTGASGNSGDGGLATNAQLGGSYGLAVDAAGDLFIADYYSLSIREVSASGIIDTVAGTGAFYSGDSGPAASAQLAPTGIAVDGSGNFYIADNSRLRKVSANGIVTTVAGTGVCCGPGGSGVTATSTEISPERVTVDASGNLYIADFFSVVHKVAPNGIITTIAGTGTAGFSGDGGAAASAQLGVAPGGLTVDGGGNLYIADTSNNRIRKVSLGGTITTVAGSGVAGFSGNGGPAAVAQLNQPQGVAVDVLGNLYIADTNNNRIRKISPGTSGVITTVAGTGVGGFAGDGGPAASAQLQNPQGIAIDEQGNLFVADAGNSRVREISAGGTITTVAGTGGSAYSGDCGPATSAQLSFPRDVAVDSSGNVFIADTGNDAVRRLQPTSRPMLICAVVDAASESIGAVSPGKIVVIYGMGLGSSPISIAAPVNGSFGTQLAGTSVSFNGVAAPLIYTLAGQVSAIVPYEVTGSSVAQANVSYLGGTSTFAVPVAAAAPSIFTANGSGAGQAAALNNVDGTLNSATNPVKIGAYIQLYATGEGQTMPGGVDGQLANTLPLPAPLLPVTATVGGIPATVYYAGAAPTEVAGVMQVDLLIPSGVQTGSKVPVAIQVGTATSGAGVWIAVAGN
jgi:uncharacterized protein (TIGR03437 family)